MYQTQTHRLHPSNTVPPLSVQPQPHHHLQHTTHHLGQPRCHSLRSNPPNHTHSPALTLPPSLPPSLAITALPHPETRDQTPANEHVASHPTARPCRTVPPLLSLADPVCATLSLTCGSLPRQTNP
ncbi:hypothetical protein K505DRAFT_59108 [Melanomma pulvis-pyrius CBS 109.77]|uniref:Uncharacterized protein n=1 Tax=Melanomma pulvis-pyrius CBS 109.77 TaxID=1314802 RepID=A0A6A6X6R2_9PLEO|nr:hypothetical protein K505DRAFT_59108 [Melanomma pulvis-pyrius CBS 109.77]